MLIKATQKNTRQTPRKVRLVANAVKKLSIEQAFKQLAVIEKKATVVVSKVLKQAVSDAIHNHGLQLEDLQLDSILVGEGPRYRRFRAVSRGRAHGIIKRTCHVTVVLRTKESDATPVVREEKTEKAASKSAAVQLPESAKKKTVKAKKQDQ